MYAILINRLNYPIFIKYGNDTLRISPREKVKVEVSKIDKANLPNGLTLVGE